MELKSVRDWVSWLPPLRRFLLNQATEDYQPEEAVDVWYKIFPSDRAVRFNEMEYHLPREQLMPTLRQVRERIEKNHREEFFPVEVRVVKGDQAWIFSPPMRLSFSSSIVSPEVTSSSPAGGAGARDRRR